MAAQVSIAGAQSVVTIDLRGDDTVVEVLQAALRSLGLPQESVTSLEPVRNGEDALLSDPVVDGDVVTAAGPVGNG